MTTPRELRASAAADLIITYHAEKLAKLLPA
jgi:delta-aminolevulinic acid dehydratase/porphobilinogen synthase